MGPEKVLSQAQVARQRTRNRGKYSRMSRCEVCGKALGRYYSDERVDRMKGYGLVLCRPCARIVGKLPDDEYIPFFKKPRARAKYWGPKFRKHQKEEVRFGWLGDWYFYHVEDEYGHNDWIWEGFDAERAVVAVMADSLVDVVELCGGSLDNLTEVSIISPSNHNAIQIFKNLEES